MRKLTKHFSVLFLFILLCCKKMNNLSAQSLYGKPLIDSLLQVLPHSKDDTSKIKTLYNLSVAYSSVDSSIAVSYATKCMNLSKKVKWEKGMGYAYQAFARTYLEVSNYSLSIQNGENALAIFKRINDKGKIASVLVTMANNYDETANYTKCIQYNLQALHFFEETNNKFGVSVAYNNMGNAYYRLLEYDKAIDSYKKSLHETNADDKYGIGSAFDNIASVFLDEGKYDSANVYNLRGIKYFEDIHHLPAMARIYFNRGNLMMKMHNAKSAYDYYQRSISIDKKIGIKKYLGNDYGAIGEMYLELAKDSSAKYILSPIFETSKKPLLQKSKDYLTIALSAIKETGDIYLLMEYTNLLSEVNERLGDYRAALVFHKDYTLYKDSIFNDDNRKKIAAMETEQLTAEKDNQIKLLNQQRALEASEVKRQTLIRNIIIACVIIAAALSYVFIRLYNRRRKIMFNSQVMEVEMKALRAQMNPHFIFNSLQSINNYVIENDKENASSYLSKFANLMRLILENSSEQEVTLEKDLDALELYMQLESLRFKNKFSYSIETDNAINKENTLIPPMLLQPFVENAIVHGMKSRENGLIKINVQKENDMIRYVVEDNGAGRENAVAATQGENKKHKSLAMKIISQRLDIINRLKKAKTALNIYDLKDAQNKPSGLRIELLLPFEPAF